MVVRVNQNLQQRAIKEAEKTAVYLREELEKTSTIDLRQGNYSLIEKQISSIAMANVRDEYAFRVIDRAEVSREDDRVFPKPIFIMALGSALGIALSSFVILLLFFFKQPVSSNPQS